MRNLVVRTLALCFILGGLAGAGPAPEPFALGPVSQKQTGPDTLEVRVKAATLQPLPLVGEVPMPVSYLSFVGRMQVAGQLLEANLLQSLYEVDLDGDGRIFQVSVKERDGALRVGQLKVEPMAAGFRQPQSPFREDGRPRTYLLSPDAPSFAVLFYEPPMMGLALQHRGHRPTVECFPNPCVQLLVFEPCGALDSGGGVPDDPTFEVAFPGNPEVHQAFGWEPWLFERLKKDLQWLRGYWVALPMPARPEATEFVFTLKTSRDTQRVGLMAQVNWAVQEGVRLRTDPMVGLLHEKAPAHVIEE